MGKPNERYNSKQEIAQVKEHAHENGHLCAAAQLGGTLALALCES